MPRQVTPYQFFFCFKAAKEKKLSFEPEPTDELAQAVEESMKGKIVHFKNSNELLKTIRKQATR
jgi:hypothetical protein